MNISRAKIENIVNRQIALIEKRLFEPWGELKRFHSRLDRLSSETYWFSPDSESRNAVCESGISRTHSLDTHDILEVLYRALVFPNLFGYSACVSPPRSLVVHVVAKTTDCEYDSTNPVCITFSSPFCFFFNWFVLLWQYRGRIWRGSRPVAKSFYAFSFSVRGKWGLLFSALLEFSRYFLNKYFIVFVGVFTTGNNKTLRPMFTRKIRGKKGPVLQKECTRKNFIICWHFLRIDKEQQRE